MITRRFIAAFYTAILLGGIGLYIGWSAYYGTWFDPGIYTISAVLIGFGLIGTLLYGKAPEKKTPTKK